MSEPLASIVDRAHTVLASNAQPLVDTLQELLRIPSLEDDAAPNAPFGTENRRALDLMLGLSQQHGLRTTDLEGYCGYAEYGAGDAMVMSLGHLDVVPVGPGWTYPAFGAEIHDGSIYARGATDDKGPTVAMFYAAMAIKEAWPDIPVRIRQVFGCNEESGFRCVERYMKTEEHPTLGVAPDAMWPLVHAEKGIATFVLKCGPIGERMRLLSVTGGQRPNIVIDHCVAQVEVDFEIRQHLQSKCNDTWDKNMVFRWDANTLTIEGFGKAAHGSTPWHGDNAATRVFRFLKEAAPLVDEAAYRTLFEVGHPGGEDLGISGSDGLTVLTANLGIVRSVAREVFLTVNVRYPVTWTGADLRAKCEKGLAQGLSIVEFEDSEPLHFPLEHPLVANIIESFREETGQTLPPETMGGGTYARAVPNCVAIGTCWPGDGLPHETDERVSVAGLQKTARIYVRVLARLAATAQGLV